MSFRLCGAGFNFLVAVCVGGPPPSLLGVRWPLAGVRQAGVASSHGCGRVSSPSGVCGGLLGLDPRLVSLVLVLWCALVRRAVSCCVLPCGVVLVHAVLWCALRCRAVSRRVVPWCAVLCRVAPCRVLVCRVVGCLVVVRCTAVHCGALCRVASCCAVYCCAVVCGGPFSLPFRRGVGSAVVRLARWCGMRAQVLWLAGGWGARLGVAWLVGSVLRGSGCAARVGGSGGCPRGCPPWGPVPWSRVLWGSLPLVLGVAAVSSSSSGARVVALAVAGVVAWR